MERASDLAYLQSISQQIGVLHQQLQVLESYTRKLESRHHCQTTVSKIKQLIKRIEKKCEEINLMYMETNDNFRCRHPLMTKLMIEYDKLKRNFQEQQHKFLDYTDAIELQQDNLFGEGQEIVPFLDTDTEYTEEQTNAKGRSWKYVACSVTVALTLAGLVSWLVMSLSASLEASWGEEDQ